MSTPEQLKGGSLQRQLERSRELAQARGWTLDESLRDLGKSGYHGTHIAEGAFGEFLDRVRTGKIPRDSVLIVESLDRLSREAVNVAMSHFLLIINAGVRLVTLDSNPPREFTADSPNLTMELMLSLMEMQRAHAESRRKSDLIKPFWNKRRAEARDGGKPLSGMLPSWLRVVDGRYEVIEDKAAVVREIFDLTVNGVGIYSITKTLNARGVLPLSGRGKEWNRSSVAAILHSESVIGRCQPHEVYYEAGKRKRRPIGEPIDGYYPAVVTLDTWNRSRAARLGRTTFGEQAPATGGQTGLYYSNLFRGLCFCGACGGKMEVFDRGAKYGGRKIQCSSVKRGAGCRHRTQYDYRQFEAAFLQNCNHFDLTRINAHQSSELTRVREQLARLDLERQDLDKRYGNLLDAIEATGMNPRLKSRMEELEAALSTNTAESDELSGKLATLTHTAQNDTIQALLEVRDRMEKVTGEDLYRLRAQIASLIREFVTGIVFYDGSVFVSIGQKNCVNPVHTSYRFLGGELIKKVEADLPLDFNMPARVLIDNTDKLKRPIIEILSPEEDEKFRKQLAEIGTLLGELSGN